MTDIIPTQPDQLILLQAEEKNPPGEYLASLQAGSRRVMEAALNTIAGILGFPNARSCPWWKIEKKHVTLIRTKLGERGYSPATIRRHLSALRGVLGKAWDDGLMSSDTYYKAIRIDKVRGSREPAGRDISPEEIARIFDALALDKSPAGARDAAILACLYPGGLRREECAALELGDYDTTSGRLAVQRGKGNKERHTFLMDDGSRAALSDWLAVRGSAPGGMFCPMSKTGKLLPGKITPQTVYNVVRRRGQRAGVDLTPHDLRRSLIGDLLDAGADPVTIAGIVGHKNVATTQGYDRRPEEVRRQALAKIALPYQARR